MSWNVRQKEFGEFVEKEWHLRVHIIHNEIERFGFVARQIEKFRRINHHEGGEIAAFKRWTWREQYIEFYFVLVDPDGKFLNEPPDGFEFYHYFEAEGGYDYLGEYEDDDGQVWKAFAPREEK